MEALITQYGYIAVLLGTFLEGETILILAAFAAHRGFLNIEWVIACAFIGTLLGDTLYYLLGRTRGNRLLDKRPDWKVKVEKVFKLLRSNEVLAILSFRFMYGIRSVSSFVIGMSRIPLPKFILLNSIGAAIWAITIGSLGYFFGELLEHIIAGFKRYEMLALGLIALTGALVWCIHFARQRSRRIACKMNTTEGNGK